MRTMQEVFDNAWHGVLGQKRPSATAAGRCLYRGPNGARCAVGWSISDSAYKSDMEESGCITEEILSCVFLPNAEESVSDTAYSFLRQLQEAHDISAQEEGKMFLLAFREAMQELAEKYNLTIPQSA